MISLFRLSASAGLLAALVNIAPAAAAPNIVLLIADDMGWGDVTYHGSDIRTPEIDRLAAEGVELNHFYATAVCSPTRATLMTGRSPRTHGVLSPFNPWYEQGLATDEKLLPEYLREAGYATHGVGKWHLGPNEPEYHPLRRGFDTFYGSMHGYLDHETRAVFGRVDWQRNGETVIEEGHGTQLVADEAVHLIESRDPDRPMFLYVSFNAPHSPLQASEETIAEYADIEDENRRVYAAMVTEMDRAIAQVTTALDAAGMAENTIVMFFTDNGGVPRLGARNLPLRGSKGQPWEGAMRVPAAIHWPGVLEGGQVFDQRITVMDLLPTFLAAAGIPLDAPKPIEGQNLWPALAEGAPTPSQDVVLSNFGGGFVQHAYFSGEWKLVRGINDDGELQDFLFDIVDDPYEESDLAGERPEVLTQLAAELDAMPVAEPLSRHDTPPDFNAPGAPPAVHPDPRPPIATPYAESGPIPYPAGGNYPVRD